jgi:hypothetical protein
MPERNSEKKKKNYEHKSHDRRAKMLDCAEISCSLLPPDYYI